MNSQDRLSILEDTIWNYHQRLIMAENVIRSLELLVEDRTQDIVIQRRIQKCTLRLILRLSEECFLR